MLEGAGVKDFVVDILRAIAAKPLVPTLLAAALMIAAGNSGLAQRRVPQASGVSSQSALEREAQIAVKAGDFQKAIQVYMNLVKSSPASAEYHYQLGAAYLAAGQPQNAAPPLREALKLKPGFADARYLLGASLAETSQCAEALPDLKQAAAHLTDRMLQRRIGIDGVNCSMELDQQDDAIGFLQQLRHRFPKDAEVLYLSVHVFSDLSTRASQALLMADPGSYQVHELNAEALEAQGKWDEAESEYRRVLAMKPDLPGIHYLIGRLILTKPKTATTFEDAKKEFEAELKINPHNAGAEFVLGELALRTQDYATAIDRFSKAIADDPNFADAKIELGRSLISTHQPAKAISPLESAVKLQPQNPSAHYLLAMAYRGAGRTQDAEKQLAAYQKATADAQQTNQEVRSGILGRKAPAQMPKAPRHSEH
jgi:tetratricopeptide (TPR) repeat protein